MIDLALHRPHPNHEYYRVRFDGIEIGSISFRSQNGVSRDTFWDWGVDTMPLMERGGRVPSGRAGSLEEAKAEFRRAFEQWIEQVPAEQWARNRDYLTYTVRSSHWQE